MAEAKPWEQYSESSEPKPWEQHAEEAKAPTPEKKPSLLSRIGSSIGETAIDAATLPARVATGAYDFAKRKIPEIKQDLSSDVGKIQRGEIHAPTSLGKIAIQGGKGLAGGAAGGAAVGAGIGGPYGAGAGAVAGGLGGAISGVAEETAKQMGFSDTASGGVGLAAGFISPGQSAMRTAGRAIEENGSKLLDVGKSYLSFHQRHALNALTKSEENRLLESKIALARGQGQPTGKLPKAGTSERADIDTLEAQQRHVAQKAAGEHILSVAQGKMKDASLVHAQAVKQSGLPVAHAEPTKLGEHIQQRLDDAHTKAVEQRAKVTAPMYKAIEQAGLEKRNAGQELYQHPAFKDTIQKWRDMANQNTEIGSDFHKVIDRIEDKAKASGGGQKPAGPAVIMQAAKHLKSEFGDNPLTGASAIDQKHLDNFAKDILGTVDEYTGSARGAADLAYHDYSKAVNKLDEGANARAIAKEKLTENFTHGGKPVPHSLFKDNHSVKLLKEGLGGNAAAHAEVKAMAEQHLSNELAGLPTAEKIGKYVADNESMLKEAGIHGQAMAHLNAAKQFEGKAAKVNLALQGLGKAEVSDLGRLTGRITQSDQPEVIIGELLTHRRPEQLKALGGMLGLTPNGSQIITNAVKAKMTDLLNNTSKSVEAEAPNIANLLRGNNLITLEMHNDIIRQAKIAQRIRDGVAKPREIQNYSVAKQMLMQGLNQALQIAISNRLSEGKNLFKSEPTQSDTPTASAPSAVPDTEPATDPTLTTPTDDYANESSFN